MRLPVFVRDIRRSAGSAEIDEKYESLCRIPPFGRTSRNDRQQPNGGQLLALKPRRHFGDPWTLTFDQSKRGPTNHRCRRTVGHAYIPISSIRHYSAVVYENRFTLDTLPEGASVPPQPQRRDSHGESQNQRRLRRRSDPPYRVEITDTKRAKTTSIDVVTSENRLIGDLLPAKTNAARVPPAVESRRIAEV